MPLTQETAKAYLEAQRRANIALARERQDPILWAQAVMHIRGNPEKPYRIDRYPFLREIVQQKAARVVVKSCAGGGKTEIFLAASLAWADWGLRVIYGFESDVKAGRIVTERVNPNIKASLYLHERCNDADNIGFKQLGYGFVYFMGLQSEGATASYHGDKLVLDELDLMDQGNIDLVKKRLTSSGNPQIFEISNPYFPDIGIDAAFKEGDQRQWHVPCKKCKALIPLSFWTHYDPRADRWFCPACKNDFDRMQPGSWKATNPEGKFPSYAITGAMNPTFNAKKVHEEVNDARASKQEAAYRMDIGQAYESTESGLSAGDLQKASHGSKWEQYAYEGFITCDPGALFDVQVWQKPIKGEAHCTWSGTVRNFLELSELVERSKVSGGVIDYMPEMSGAKEFVKRWNEKGKNFLRAGYLLEKLDGPLYDFETDEPSLVRVQRTLMADEMVSEVRKRNLLFPKRLTDDPESEWFKHMRAPKRLMLPTSSGIPKPFWRHDANRPDHQFHCSLYACLYIKCGAVGGSATAAEVEIEDEGW